MENIVQLSNLDTFIQGVIDKTLNGVNLARADGHLAEVPTKIDFDIVVVESWQALEIASGETSRVEESQGGGTVEESVSKSNDTTNRAESQQSKDTSNSTENSVTSEKSTSTETSQGTETQNRVEASSQKETRKQRGDERSKTTEESTQTESSDGSDTQSSLNSNAHVQNSEDASDTTTTTS